MVVIFGPRWTSTNGISPQDDSGKLTLAGDTWSVGLRGLTPQQVGIAIDACITRGLEWPPTVGAFRGMGLEIPTLERVLGEIRSPNRKARSPFSCLVWQHVDAHVYRQSSDTAARRLLADAYELARELRMEGAELPVPEKDADEVEKPKPCTPPEFHARIDALRAELEQPYPEEDR